MADSRSLILERALVCLESFMLHYQNPPLGRENFSHQDIINIMVSLLVSSIHKQSEGNNMANVSLPLLPLP
jgi:hypothetical protein